MTTTTQNQYPLRQLGKNGPLVSALGFGTLAIAGGYGSALDEASAMEVLSYAADRGLTFWDTADVYKTSEATLGKWFAKTGRRSDIFLASKFGAFDTSVVQKDMRAAGPNSKPSYIVNALERSLAALQTDYLDLYYQHRVDPAVPIEVALEALRPAVEKGTVRWLGLCECDPDELRRAKAVPGLGDKVVALQYDFSPFSLDAEKNEIAATAEELGISIVAHSPLGRGLVTGQIRDRSGFEKDDIRQWLPRFSEENFPKNLLVVDHIHAVAAKYGCSPSQATLAWILAEHPTWVVMTGSRAVARVEENARGAEIELLPEAVQEIRKLAEEAEVHGHRHGYDAILSSLPLAEWKGE